MTIKTTTHLNFRGNARSVLDFYQSVFGGKQTIVSYRDAGAVQNPDEAEQVMWGQVAADNGFRIMAYDVPSRLDWNPGEIPVFVSVRGNDAEEVAGYWQKLAADARILQPLAPAGWSPLYGMLRDRYGITWVLDVEVAYASA
ncbi:VOC family protein [Devosia sp. A16]|uniref:VOC family protein n=1 Tax=Devosia sp. A16 TaxID=1736675 RepID=UPI0006D7E924|nr:VOC family protein [Devosia sp. A16]